MQKFGNLAKNSKYRNLEEKKWKFDKNLKIWNEYWEFGKFWIFWKTMDIWKNLEMWKKFGNLKKELEILCTFG